MWSGELIAALNGMDAAFNSTLFMLVWLIGSPAKQSDSGRVANDRFSHDVSTVVWL